MNKMSDLWKYNSPQKFWLCHPDFSEEIWSKAFIKAAPILGFDTPNSDINKILAMTLGEERFGANHWKLSTPKRVYYLLKPYLPRVFTRLLRKVYSNAGKQPENWPIDSRYAQFQFELLRQALLLTGKNTIQYTNIWPNGSHFALILTHDIETAQGQAFVRKIADLEENLGFRSSFNFVLERYPLDFQLMDELRQRGFEIGCHGLKHDGRKFDSRQKFEQRAERINTLIKQYGISGFRSPLTHRNPQWMQSLKIEYDSSFFDTDPFEPISGGAMSIWPYFLGNFMELPYTLVQDHTLGVVLGQKTPRIWLDKINFLQTYRGMALLNSHPDYLSSPDLFDVYANFLQVMKENPIYWHALPLEVAHWWKYRATSSELESSDTGLSTARLEGDSLVV
jgi:peptidoglycan/xylan/chitin deacetylase (PgdA/CDA1 family)